jgi:hypothetical protein
MAAARVRSDTEEPQARPRNDAYTGMLLISLAALVVGCVLLLLDMLSYGDMKPPAPNLGPPAKPAPAPKAPSP